MWAGHPSSALRIKVTHYRVAGYEERFGVTIQRKASVRELAAKGSSFVALRTRDEREAGRSKSFAGPVTTTDWTLPAGAFAECGGPL